MKLTRRAITGIGVMIFLLGILVFFHPSFIGKIGNLVDFFREDIRHVSVCTLNDSRYPVRDSLVSYILDVGFRVYKEKVGIVLHAEGIAPFKEELDDDFDSWGARFAKVCPAEIVILFTNRPIARLNKRGEMLKEYGEFSYQVGFVSVHNVERRFSDKTAGGIPLPLHALQHGLAHLFGVGHTSDKESIMYDYSNDSHGRWTNEVIKTIKRNKHREWR